MMDERSERNLAEQTRLYGAPLGDIVRRILPVLGLSQAALARTLGLSAPMLSQLMQAQRVKIGNPAVVQRLEAVIRLADDVAAGSVPADEVPARLASASETTGVLTTANEVPATSVIRAFVTVPGEDLAAAVSLLAPSHPELSRRLAVASSGSDAALAALLRGR
ncbi:MAG: hypothetical protein QM607_06630 [Microbacterium sp.]